MSKKQPNSYFKFKQFTIHQDKCAMKVGTDGVLLGAWANVVEARNVLDIGSGTGLISIMLAQRNLQLYVDSIDIDAGAIEQTKTNFHSSPFADRLCLQHSSLQNLLTEKKYDLIVSNPPYFKQSLKSTDAQRNLARHTDSLSVDDLIHYTSSMLSDKGIISLIYPYEYKELIIEIAKQYELYIIRLTNVYPTPLSEAKRILVEMSTRKTELKEDDLVIENERHVYSSKFSALVKDFYLNIQ